MGINEKIKICHLISGDLWAGAEVQMFTLMRALCDCFEFDLWAAVLNEGVLAEKLREIGLKVTVLDEKRLSFFQIRRGLEAFLAQVKPTILHTHRYKENILGGLSKSNGKVRYLVQTVHGIGEPFRGFRQVKSKLYFMANNYISKKHFDRIIAVSNDIHGTLDRYFDSSKVITIHNAIDSNKLMPERSADLVRTEFGIKKDVPIIGSVGRMVPVKGFDLFLEMAGRIISEKPQVRFLLVGDGPLRPHLEKRAAEMGLLDNLIFAGFRRDVTALINCLDIFVMTSYHEGIPMALLEAMALGKAVVSTAVGGVPEIIEDGISGFLVKPNDVRQLTATCNRLLADQGILPNLAAGARSVIEKEYSINVLRERVAGLYKELLNTG